MGKRIRKIILVLILVLLCAGCGSSADENVLSPSQIVTVQRGDLIVEITASGNLKFSQKVDLAFELNGIVQEVLVEVGDHVKKGQILAKLDTSAWESELLALERSLLQAKVDLKQAELNLENAKYGGTARAGSVRPQPDPLDIEIKELQVELARLKLKDAQRKLEEAKKVSPFIIAPFDGFITKVNVSGGDEVKKGTVAISLADPKQFEVDILINEMDISKVNLGGDVSVQVNAISGVVFPAKVKSISPTATIQAGVVNYQVKVELTSLQPMRAIQSGAARPLRGTQPLPALGTETLPFMSLKEGLTVTASILVERKEKILLVPNQAVLRKGRETVVQVVKNGVVEELPIKVGISNWQWTEVVSGLNEGDKVVIPKLTAATPQPRQQTPPSMIMPGIRIR